MIDKRSQYYLDLMLLKELRATRLAVERLGCKLEHRKPHLYLFFLQGDKLVAGSISIQLSPTASVPATAVETNADGSVFQFNPANIEWSVQDNTIVKVTQNPDGSAVFTPLAAGSTQVGVADTSTGLSDVGAITVTPASASGPVKMTLTFGTPTP